MCRNSIPYNAVKDLSNVLELTEQEQVEFFAEAGYQFPAWVSKVSLRSEVRPIAFKLGNTANYYRYQVERLGSASDFVDDLTWGINLPNYTKDEDVMYDEYLSAISSACQRGVIYREVMTFTNHHYLDRAKSMLDQNLLTYNLRYFDVGNFSEVPPLLHFWIVDRKEVSFAFYKLPYSPHTQELKLAVNEPDVVEVFFDYFDSIWQKATPIKDGDFVNWEEFEKIQQKYT